MKITSIFSRSGLTIMLIVGFIGMLMFACTKYDDPAPYFEEFDSSDIPLKRKVLLISIDGMAGPEIEKIQPPFISEMLDHSKYSWKAMTDRITTDAATWESLMTGYSVDKHQIKDSSFEVNTADDGELEDVVIPAYPTFLKRLSALRPAMKFYAASPWKELNEKALANVDKQVTAANDKEVRDSTVSQLKNGESDILIANFNEVNIAGKEGEFSAENAGYKDAVLKVDDYVKDLVETLKQRPDYKEEQWLVILTSNHGGMGNSYGGITVKEREVLTAYYNPHFESYEVPGYDLAAGVTLQGTDDGKTRAVLSNDQAYNFGDAGNYTVQFDINVKDMGGNYPAFFGKRKNGWSNQSGAGWAFRFKESGWDVLLGSSSSNPKGSGNTGIEINQWNTLTMQFKDVGAERFAYFYTNGKKKADSIDITGINFNNTYPLVAGYIDSYKSGKPAYNFSNLRIWDTALSDSAIIRFGCGSVDYIEDKYESHLIGYWPMNEGSGKEFKDQSSSGNNFDIENLGSSSWDLISAFNGCKVDDGTSSKSDIEQITNFDIPVQIFYWLRVNVSPDWDWTGNRFLDRFEKEFYQKRNED